jgi:DUF917 family protein
MVYKVENTMSLAWRIGRAVALSRWSNMVDTVAESIAAEVGGSESARILFKGKIVRDERVLKMGHAYGEFIVDSTTGGAGEAKEPMILPFKNGKFHARKENGNGKGEVCFDPICFCGRVADMIRFLLLSRILSAFSMLRTAKHYVPRSIDTV